MKKAIGLLIFLLPMCRIIGQPTINNFGDYQPGDIFNYVLVLDLNGLLPFAKIGNDTIWDLSNIELEDSVRKSTVINCSNPSYQDCSYVLSEFNGLLQFYKNHGDTLFYLGNNTNDHSNVFMPPVPVFIKPMSLGDTLAYSTYLLTTPLETKEWFHFGHYKAYGTLKLPNNVQYTNIALVYEELGRTDGSYISISYFWVREDETLLARIQFAKFGNADPVLEIGTVTPNIEPLYTDEQLKRNKISITPNPTTDLAMINVGTLGKNLEVQVINLNGQIIMTKTESNRDQIAIDLSRFPAGIYFISVNTYEGVFTDKIIKE